jgi:hypothetical protein
VAELLQRITSAELAEWMAYYLLQDAEPRQAKAKSEISRLKGAGVQNG